MSAAVLVQEMTTEGRNGAAVQVAWAGRTIADRLRVLGAARHLAAAESHVLAGAISEDLSRTRADSLVAEVLPLLAAIQFLEREADEILMPRKLGRSGLPFWLAGLDTTVERVPFGRVLVIAPANYPLLLAGVQVVQALVAGNSVVWKPGLGGRTVAICFATILERCGLPVGLLRVTDESADAGVQAIQNGTDKIFFTGSGVAGRAVLKLAAETATPVVAELSGCDAVVVLPSADVRRVAAALEFGMRLNGSETCMAPRRLLLVGTGHEALLAELQRRFAAMDGVVVRPATRLLLQELVNDAAAQGAEVVGNAAAEQMQPLLVLRGRATMRLAAADVFAPVLTVLECADADEAVAVESSCGFGLTVAVFGETRLAEALAKRFAVGTVVVNDLIVPTADPRVSFGGRRGSGYGSTRGREGLLEMTAVRTLAVRQNKETRQYEKTSAVHEAMFTGMIQMTHGSGFSARFAGLRAMIAAARKLS